MAHIVKVLCTDYINYNVAAIAEDIHMVHRFMFFLSP